MAQLTAPFDVPQKPGDEIRIQAAAVKNYRGGAASIVAGTGYATPLVVANAGGKFIGVYTQSNDNSLGVAGTINNGPPNSGLSSWVTIARRGVFAFNQAGILQASVGSQCWFSDDNTVTTTPGIYLAGTILDLDNSGVAWVCIDAAVNPSTDASQTSPPVALAANTAIFPRNSGLYVITKGSIEANTLAAPTAGADDGLIITIVSNTAFAHTLTATGLLQTGSASVNVATFAAFAGASITLYAYQGKWIVLSSTAITFS
jgi:hypothetical protein